MKNSELLKLYKSYPIGSTWMYDHSLGKGDFRKVTISRIEVIKTIPCFRFNDITGFWPIETKLIKRLDEIGKGSTCQNLINNRFDKSFNYCEI